jgi:RNA polymerase sigma-70 factor (ECF subfamily)
MAELDAALVARCLRGETEAYDELVRRHEKALYNGALRIVRNSEDARDIVQGVFVKAYEKLASYDPERKFFSWIYRMMVNASLNWLDSRRGHLELEADLPSKDPSPEGEFVRGEETRRLEEALARLKPELRLAVVLKYFGELSYDELSYVLDLPAKTVKSRIYEARRILATYIIEAGVSHGTS